MRLQQISIVTNKDDHIKWINDHLENIQIGMSFMTQVLILLMKVKNTVNAHLMKMALFVKLFLN